MTQLLDIVGGLNPDDCIEVDLRIETLQHNWSQVLSAWVRRPPFYARDTFGRVRVICARYDDVREVLQDRDRFSVAIPPGGGNEAFDFFMGLANVAQTDGVAHDRIRRLLAPAFGPAAVAPYIGRIHDLITQLLDAVEAKGTGEFEAMSDFCSHLIAEIVLEMMLGFKHEQIKAFSKMNVALELLPRLAPGEPFPDAYVVAFAKARTVIADLVEERRRNPGDDYISALIQARDGDDHLTTEEIIGNIFAIAAGGLSTTATALGAALYNLCRHPEQLDALKADLSLVSTALEECLRYQSPGILTFARFAKLDTEVGGTLIYAGTPVQVSTQGANLDPARYPDPLRFDISRDPKGINTFGGGMHLCIGFRIARAIMRTSLENILQRFPNLRLADPDFEPTYHGMFSLTPRAIPLRVD